MNGARTTKSPDYYYYDSIPFRTAGTADSSQFNFTSWYIGDRTDFNGLENKAGIKFALGNYNFVGYVRNKNFRYKQLDYARDTIPGRLRRDTAQASPYLQDSIPIDRSLTENFIGISTNYIFKDSISKIFLDAEYLFLGTPANQTLNDYLLKFSFTRKWLYAGASAVLKSPTLVQQAYRGNVLDWNYTDSATTLKQVLSQEIYAGINFNWKNLQIAPRFVANRIHHLIYYDTLAVPRQSEYKLDLPSIELLVKYKLYKFHFELFGKYTKEYGATYFRVPEIYNHNRVYFEGFLYKKFSLFQIGFDTYWKSSYNAYKYMPVNQQFYLNENWGVSNYLLADVFLNIQIKAVRVFLKMSHVNQAPDKGYFVTPYYSGLPRTFEFGLNWKFYD